MTGDVSVITHQCSSSREKPSMRSRTGCLTCRRRKKKCDESHPSCSGCRRNNLECYWESNAPICTTRRKRKKKVPEVSLPGQAQGMVHVFSILTPDTVSRLLGHFFNESPKWLSTRVGPRRTEYMKCLSPAISKSPLIFDCVLAIASADLRKYSRGNPEAQYVAAEYYGKAVRGLRAEIETEISALTPNLPFSDYTPLAVILLCLHETQNFTDRERIIPHLNAAVFLLQNRVLYDSSSTAMRNFLLETFCYFFSLSAFSLPPQLLFDGAYRIFNSPSVLRDIQSGLIMGTSQRLFIIIYRLRGLTQQLKLDDQPEREKAEKELQLLDQELSSISVRPEALQTMKAEHLHDSITSELYRLACRAHIRHLIYPSTQDEDDTRSTLMEDFISSLQLLPAGSPSNSILSWPLVVAGSHANKKPHQRIIIAKLAQIYEEVRSDVFSESASYLRKIWNKGNTPRRDIVESASSENLCRQNISAWHECPVILA